MAICFSMKIPLATSRSMTEWGDHEDYQISNLAKVKKMKPITVKHHSEFPLSPW